MGTIRVLSEVITSRELAAAVVIGVLLVMAPLAPVRLLPSGRLVAAIPVALGFGLAAYPLWASGTTVGIAASVALAAVGCSLLLVPRGRVPRPLHAISPIAGLVLAL